MPATDRITVSAYELRSEDIILYESGRPYAQVLRVVPDDGGIHVLFESMDTHAPAVDTFGTTDWLEVNRAEGL